LKTYQQPSNITVELLNISTLLKIPSLQQCYSQLSNWDWRFGKTPNFEYNLETRFQWGIIDLHIHVSKGLIEETKIFSDALVPPLIELLMKHLVGVPYSRDGVKLACNKVRHEDLCVSDPAILNYINEFEQWLSSNL